jgi:hypothetical protein
VSVFPAGHILTSADFDTLFPTGVAAPATYTPVVTQSNTPTLSVEYAAYQKVGRWVQVLISVNITANGTANNAIVCTFPAAAGTLSSYRCLGTGAVYDASAALWYSGQVSYNTATTFVIIPNGVPALGATGSTMTAALANGDKVSASLQFYTTT